MGWVTDDDDTTVWHDVARFKQFWQAIHERHQVIDGTSDTSALPAVDVICHGAGPAGTGADRQFPITAIDNWIGANTGAFVAIAVPSGGGWSELSNYDGQPLILFWGGETNLDLGYAGLYEYVSGKKIETIAAVPPGTDPDNPDGSPAEYRYGFTRKYPKEFATLTTPATAAGGGGYLVWPSPNSDATAGDFKEGDVAQCIETTWVYKRVSGAWVRQAEGVLPDVFDDAGNFSEGDIVGPWIWNERRKALKALKWTGTLNTAYTGGETYGGDSTADTVPLSTSKANASAAYALTGSGASGTVLSATSVDLNPDGSVNTSSATLANGTKFHLCTGFGATLYLGATDTTTRTFDWYYAPVPGSSDNPGTGTRFIFDGFGTVVSDGHYHLKSSDAPGTAAHAVADDEFHTETTAPPYPPDPPITDGGVTYTTIQRGWHLNGGALVIKWAFEFI